jgi:hypothetical protein
MAKDFRAVMAELGAKIGADEMAAELGVSLQTIKQARMEADSAGRRPAPEGWEKAARKLAQRQAAYFQRLAEKLG